MSTMEKQRIQEELGLLLGPVKDPEKMISVDVESENDFISISFTAWYVPRQHQTTTPNSKQYEQHQYDVN